MFGGGVALCSLATAFSAHASPLVSNRRVLARFANSPDDPANAAILSQYGATIIWRAHMVPGLVSIKCPQLNAAAVAKALSESANVKYAECSTGDTNAFSAPCQGHAGDPSQLPVLTTANVSSFQWARNNYGLPIAGIVGTSGRDLKLDQAWQRTMGSPDIVVAVVDNSISIDHPALVNSLWTNIDEIPADGIDNDGNGIVDDVHGAKFGEALSGDPRPRSHLFNEWWSHGTSAAGLAVANPGFGMAGVAPGCRLMSLALFDESTDEFDFWAERTVMALDYALHKKARVSSFSFAINLPTAFKDLLLVAEDQGHIVVAAAGNSNCNCDFDHAAGLFYFPAAFSREFHAVVGVAATDHNDCLAVYNDAHGSCVFGDGSNFGLETILLAAPGWRNVSLRMMNNPVLGLYTWFNGTSAATPQVAGAVALLLSIHPELTCNEVKEELAASVRWVPSLDGITISGGTLDVGKLINP